MANTLNGEDSEFYVNMENATNRRADLIEFTPSGGLVSTNVQAALEEVEAGSTSVTDAIAFAIALG